jgi:hypothetical protein
MQTAPANATRRCSATNGSDCMVPGPGFGKVGRLGEEHRGELDRASNRVRSAVEHGSREANGLSVEHGFRELASSADRGPIPLGDRRQERSSALA